MDINILAEKIRNKISEGSNALKDTRLRTEVKETLRHNKYGNLLQLSQTKPEELMAEFTKFFIVEIWPQRPDLRFQSIAEYLKPLKEIEEILNPEELNQSVFIRSKSCVVVDDRISIIQFKNSLLGKVFNSLDDS
jgi:lambda repressor-like predicted transcriptional regulator